MLDNRCTEMNKSPFFQYLPLDKAGSISLTCKGSFDEVITLKLLLYKISVIDFL